MSTEPKTYDLVIIGGGPAGIVGAATAAGAGKKVALVDNHYELGGAGVNTGTVPSKTLRETALALSGVKARRLIGVDLSVREQATVGDFLRHEQQVKEGFNSMIAQQLHADLTDLYFGTGTFVDPHLVHVEPSKQAPARGQVPAPPVEVVLRGESILIATGSSPFRPPNYPFGTPEVYDSDTILQLDLLPRRIAVVGAGVIGSEYACTFAALGAQVHLIDGRDKLLPFLDGEVSRALTAAMERGGITFHWNEQVKLCDRSGSSCLKLDLASGTSLEVDAVLVAAGRKCATENLNLAAAGVKVGERGVIPVDAEYRTNVPHIYAAGDVIGFPALASTSMEQGRRAARHAIGQAGDLRLSPLLPNGIYTIPEVSMVGETEESLQKKGVDYVAGRADYRRNARGRIIGDLDGFLKLLFRRNDMKLLGVHIIGEQATEVVHIGLMAMLSDSTADVFVEACFNMPTLGGLYKSATTDALLRKGGARAALTALAEA
ncbi:MAG TPA: Si-specific NAD(P)(+) transhydrogenase [Candidatus Acidoferrum sp.]|nr:Si-specific NAD(P)(+) transhydrogenase [Candidatus Acidoferrum sp.]